MILKPTLFLSIFALVLFFPEEVLSLIRSIRHWLEDDIRRRLRARVGDDEWGVLKEELDREFAD